MSSPPVIPRFREGARRAAVDTRAAVSAIYREERAVFLLAGAAVFIGLALLAYALIQGRYIPPEGDLKKPITFNIALGIFVATQALMIPFSRLKARGRARWRRWTVGALLFAVIVETVQQLRGLDPRFTRHGSPVDQVLGGVFFLDALIVMVLFLVVIVSVMRARAGDENKALRTALGYAMLASVAGFGSGFWMSANQGPLTGQTSILPLHALGFHGLQMVPLVALMFSWARVSPGSATKWVHWAGVSWVGATLAVAWQTIDGRPLSEVSVAVALAAVFLADYAIVAAIALYSWLGANTSSAPAMQSI